jgi:succinylglutamate desuccinylase
MQLKTIGTGSPIVTITACVHGNEILGKRTFELVEKLSITKGTVNLILANEPAILAKKRFIDADLNRSFPGSASGNTEQRIAAEIMPIISKCDFLLDLHTTTGSTEPMLIVTKKTDLPEKIPVANVILIQGDGIASEGNLITNTKNGIVLELFEGTPVEQMFSNVQQFLLNTGIEFSDAPDKKTVQKKHFRMTGSIPKQDNSVYSIINFQDVKTGDVIGQLGDNKIIATKNFIPIFLGEQAYTELCMTIERIY